MNKKGFVYVALDHNSQGDNIQFANVLSRGVDSKKYGFKINLDSLANFSPHALNPYFIIRRIKELGRPVFVDMKMWNGGRTMENVAKGCAELGVDIINMYPHAGEKFMRKVKKALEGSNTKLFGLTVLTHYTDADTERLYGKNLKDATVMLARMNYNFGADGIILPGTQLGNVTGIHLPKMSPGIRPLWYENKRDNFQEQIVTPSEAIHRGARYIVVGSPIAKSEKPEKALEKILSEVS